MEIEWIRVDDYNFEQEPAADPAGSIIKCDAADSRIGLDLPDAALKGYPGLKLGQAVVKEEKAGLKNVIDTPGIQSGAKSDQKNHSFIRISEQKVNDLVDMLGELLITESFHKQEIRDLLSDSVMDSRLSANILRMERITKDIQDISMSLRMVSLKQTFQKLLRVGRDTARDLKKDVGIGLLGEDTEIDRIVVEKIQDPLMHLVRNAIAHGIEGEDERRARNKPPEGQVVINACNKGGFLYIEVADDGKGLEIEKLYRKAKEKGLIDPGRKYSDDEVLKFIYLPGFSTQENIDNISGRGVGMNVVETEVLKIGGKIEISNRPGRGCTFTLKIPINLATINGTVIDLFGWRYILPTLHIKQLVKPDVSQWVKIKGKPEMIRIHDEIIQVIPIKKILDIDGIENDLKDVLIIVLELDNVSKALPVKKILGKQDVVVKPLGTEFRNLNYISGATILGDGRVSLILDIDTLFSFGARSR
jgi:two-component system chemotaxis sensor kinase CheA